ncbi:MAG: family 10 glycosylhydrolase [Vicinamibacteria bacterium]|nr:family 10 glycosylhydrolase [Vicinamibacteria bacterium]
MMQRCFVLFVFVLASSSGAEEVRGLWVVRTGLTSEKSVDAVVDKAHEAGLNALFVQIRGRGDAFYASAMTPRSPLLSGEPIHFDPLSRVIARAGSRGIRVHAWFNVLLSAHFGQPLPRGHELERRPEWIMVPRSVAREASGANRARLPRIVREGARQDGDAEGYYLSPLAPGVPEHLERVLRELLTRYAVDGVHLDFIRYPSPEYDYSAAALRGFGVLRGVAGNPLAAASREPRAWQSYLRDSLTDLTSRLSRAARETRPKIVISAAVVPDRATAYSHKFQDWPRWLAREILDAVCPMAYSTEDRIFRNQIEDVRLALRTDQSLWAGIGAYRLSAEGVLAKVRLARSAGAHGVLLFSHEWLNADLRRRLRQEVFAAEIACGPPAPCPITP